MDTKINPDSVLVYDLGQGGGIYAAQADDGSWRLGRFSLRTGQISNGCCFARGTSRRAVLDAGYDTPYPTLEDVREAAQAMAPRRGGTAPNTSLHLSDEQRQWLKQQGGIQPTIQRLIDERMQ